MDNPNGRTQCGYCMEEGDQLTDPRSLPCQHIHCYPCLVGDFDTNRIVRCGKCKMVFDVTLARLPLAMNREDRLQVCDVCSQKGKADEPAVTYCTDCKKKICPQHLELHKEFHPLHKTLLSVEEYQQNAKLYDVRNCTRHDHQPIILGCSSCYKVLCVDCMDGTKKCVDGSAHQPVTLRELVKEIEAEKNRVKVKAQVKEGELSALLKRSTKVLSDYERKTEQLIEQLHKTRDEQLSELRTKYDNIERELLENRQKSKEQLVDFMEREVGVRMTEINTLLLLQGSLFKDSHQVDIVDRFTATVNEMKRFIDEDLPSFELTNQRRLLVQGELRDIELKIGDDTNIPVSFLPPPSSLRLKKVVNILGPGLSVCHHERFTYIRSDGSTIYRIDENGSSETCSPIREKVNWICAYPGNKNLYLLVKPRKILVTDLNMKRLTSWSHPDESSYITRLAVTGDRIVALDWPNKRLTVYSLDGQFIKNINCPQGGGWTAAAICAADQESVVVSLSKTSTVLKVDIETGEVMWTSTAVVRPGGVVCYANEYVLVTPMESEHTEIHILHAGTGRYIRKLVDERKWDLNYSLDLCITGDTLIVPKRKEQTVLYYQLVSQ